MQLGEYALFYNDPNLINTRTDKMLKVTAVDVQRVAAKYLTKENRSVIVTTPKPRGRERRPAVKPRLLVVALVGAWSLSLAAQQPPGAPAQQNPSTAPGTILKNKAPVSKEALKVTLPKPQEADLSNGVHLIVLEDHRTPLVSFQMIIDGAGGYYDPPSLPGLAGFTATSCARAPRRRPPSRFPSSSIASRRASASAPGCRRPPPPSPAAASPTTWIPFLPSWRTSSCTRRSRRRRLTATRLGSAPG